MDPRLKNLMMLLQDEKTQFQVLTRELSPHMPTLKKSEQDRVFKEFTFEHLHRQWLKNKAQVN